MRAVPVPAQALLSPALSLAAPPPGGGLTEVEMTAVAGRIEQWLRFGRVAATRSFGPHRRIACFRPGATFALVRASRGDYGALHAHIAIIVAVVPGASCMRYPCVRPGGDILLDVTGLPTVRGILRAIDAVEAAGIDPCEAAPDHWRQLGRCLAAGLPVRPYGAERHAAWLRRRESEG